MPLLKIEEAEGYMLACVHKIRAIPQWNEILSEGYFYFHMCTYLPFHKAFLCYFHSGMNFNTYYVTDSYFNYVLKMEYG